MTVNLIPSKKIVFPQGEVRFGDNESVLFDLLGKGQDIRNRRYYDDSGVAVEFDDKGGVLAVEFLSGEESVVHPILYDRFIFESPADEIVALLSEKDGDGYTLDGGYTYVFPHIGIGLYRELTPNDVEQMRREMTDVGIDPEKSEDFRTDRKRAERWATLTITARGYYSK